MQPKDTSKAHLYISLVKSVLRLMAGASLMAANFWMSGLLLILAEGLGILEEVV